MSEAKTNMDRVPITFDCSDPTQKMVCDLLKNAGYGKRTPIVVKAICLLMGSAAAQEKSKNAAATPQNEVELIEHAVDAAFKRYFGTAASSTAPETTAEANNFQATLSAPTQEASGLNSPGEDDSSILPVPTASPKSVADKLDAYSVPQDVLQDALTFADMFG